MNNIIHIQEGTAPTSLPLLLLQVLNLSQISPEVETRAQQLELTHSIELARRHISEAVHNKQPVWKRNEQLVQSNHRLLELISSEVQSYVETTRRNRALLDSVSRLEPNRDLATATPDSADENQLEKRLEISLNYTVNEHPINNFQPLLPDDVEVMLHTFLPHNPGIHQGIQHANGHRRSVIQLPRNEVKTQNSRTGTRRRRTAESSSLLNILTTLYNYTQESDTVKGETPTWELLASHVSISGLEKNPFRRNEQLQNINLQLQKMVFEVIKEQKQKMEENFQLQHKLMKSITERRENEQKQKNVCGNETNNDVHLQNKRLDAENTTEGNELKVKLEPVENNTTKQQEERNLTYPEKDKQLLEASKIGNLSAALFLTSIHANVSTHDENNTTPLHWAAKNNHFELARALLEAGSNPNAKDINGNTPLHLAAEFGITEILDLLINSTKTLETKNTVGEIPLHVAIRSGNNEAAFELIKLGSNLTSRNILDRTPLHLAAQTGKEDVVQMLVDSGSEVDARSGNGYTPLHLAALHGHVGVCGILLDGGADVNAFTVEMQTPLHFAVLSGHFSTVKLLVQRGAKVKVKNSKGRTPSGIAVRKGFKRIVTFLGQQR